MKMVTKSSTYYVYIVRCRNRTLYTGYTNNLEHRLKLHNSGKGAKYTRGRGPVKLVYCKKYRYRKRVMQEEIRIKKLRQYQKEKLVKEYGKF
jgi:putative endonuclease